MTEEKIDYKSIISYLAFVLKHKPHVAKLKLDDEGWAEISKIIFSLERHKKIKITSDDLIAYVKKSANKIFKISDDLTKIKAISGHTVLLGFDECFKIPNKMYIKLNKKDVGSILESGIIMKVGVFLYDKSLENPSVSEIIAIVDSYKASSSKIKFYFRQTDGAYFCFNIPSKFISFSTSL